MRSDDPKMTDPAEGDNGPALFATIHHKSDERPNGYTAEDIAELNRIANRRRGTMSPRHGGLYLAGSGIALVVLLAAGAAWLSPRWVPGQIVKAAEIGDRSKLEQLVNFSGIQTTLKTDVQDIMKASYRRDITATDDPFTLMFSGIGDSIVEATAESLVDQIVTPLALEKAARGEEVQFSLFGDTRSALPAFRHAGNGVPSFTARGRYLTFSRYEFTLRSIDTDQKFKVQMRRTGPFTWRVDRVLMDPSFLTDLQNGEADPIEGGAESVFEAPEVSTTVADDAPPSFQPGQRYSTYRQELLKQGFVPVPQAHPEPNYFCGTEFLDEGEPDLCVAYPEVEDCAGTGMRPCTFVFRRSQDGRRLDVSTVGEFFSQISVQNTEWRD
jgi:hypothetical protein